MKRKLGRDKGRGDRHKGQDRSVESRHGCTVAALMKAVRKINECLLEQAAESRHPPLETLRRKEPRSAIKEKTEWDSSTNPKVGGSISDPCSLHVDVSWTRHWTSNCSWWLFNRRVSVYMNGYHMVVSATTV